MRPDPIVRLVFATLDALAPESERDALVGDLHEEWLSIVVPERGEAAARRWLVKQAAQSIVPLLVLRIRRGETAALLAIAFASFASAAGAVAGAAIAWRWVLFQVPLRAAHAPPVYWIVGVVVFALAASSLTALLAAWFLGVRRRRPS